MQFGPALDTAIGLVLVYVVLSLMVTTIMEVIAAVMNLRGKRLLQAIDNLTNGLPQIPAATAAAGRLASDAIAKVSDHPLVSGTQPGRMPSYVEAANFAKAVLDHLTAFDPAATTASIQAQIATITDDRVRRILANVAQTAGGNVIQMEAQISQWFNGAMDRVSGEYKRQSQRILLIVGIVAAVVLNASTFKIVDELWRDPSLRAAAVQEAAKRVDDAAKTAPAAPAPASAAPAPSALVASEPTPELDAATADLVKAQKDVANLSIPLGWSAADLKMFQPPQSSDAWLLVWNVILLIAGWLITALAVSMGSPFWFDLLQRLINIRNSGPKPGSPKKIH